MLLVECSSIAFAKDALHLLLCHGHLAFEAIGVRVINAGPVLVTHAFVCFL